MTLMMMHLNDPLPDLRQLRPDVPTELVTILEKALAKNREGRYPSMAEFAGALRGVLDFLRSAAPAATQTDEPGAHARPLPPAASFESFPGQPLPPPPLQAASTASPKPLTGQSPARPANLAAPTGPAVPAGAATPARSRPSLALWGGIAGTGVLIVIAVLFLLREAGSSNTPPTAQATSAAPSATAAIPSPTTPAPTPTQAAPAAVPLSDEACLAGPGADYPVLAQLRAGQVLQVTGISPDEAWWTVESPDNPEETCWLQRSRADFSGDISTLPLAEVPAEGASVTITQVSLNDQGRYAAEFSTRGFTPALPGTHLHFFFDTFSADQVGSTGGGNRLMYGGASPFTGYTQADLPPGATQMCALVANPDHTVIAGSGNCSPLPEVNLAQELPGILDAARSWPVAIQESFANNLNYWPTGQSSSADLGSINRRIENGRYRWEITSTEPSVWWAASDKASATDFYLAVILRQVTGPEAGEFGLIFRKNANQEYLVFKISPIGRYALYLYRDAQWTALIDWSDTGSIQPGEDNRMEVIARGSTLYLVLNGELIAQHNQDFLDEGQAGLFVGTSNPGDAGVWEFDDFEVRLPGQ